MQRSLYAYSALFLSLMLLAPRTSRADDVLQQVPGDALGFIVVHNLAAVDSKVTQTGSLLGRDIPKPLAFLKQVTGVAEGLDSQGDFLLALLPAGDANAADYHYAAWLPASDYNRLLNSLGAKLQDGITIAKVAGENVLVARRGAW